MCCRLWSVRDETASKARFGQKRITAHHGSYRDTGTMLSRTPANNTTQCRMRMPPHCYVADRQPFLGLLCPQGCILQGAEIGFGNCFRALGVLESRDPGANVGAFFGNMPIPPRAPGARGHYLVTVTFEWSFAHDRHL